MTALSERIAAAVETAGCLWPDAPCPCVRGECPVDVAGAFAQDDGGTDPGHAAEWDYADANGGGW